MSARFTPAADESRRERDLALVQGRVSRSTPGVVKSVDLNRLAPSFFVAGRTGAPGLPNTIGSLDEVALEYLDRHRDLYGLGDASVSAAAIGDIQTNGRGGLVQVNQHFDGREVYATRMTFVIDDNRELVAITGNLQALDGISPTIHWDHDERAALLLALSDLTGVPVDAGAVTEISTEASRHAIRFQSSATAGFAFPQAARVRQVYYPRVKSVEPAYSIALEVAPIRGTSSRAYEYVISAATGDILERHNRTFSEANVHRVWSESANDGFRPTDGPQADVSPHPTGDFQDEVPIVASGSTRRFVEIDGLNVNPEGGTDPWLTADAANLRFGNNVSAYADHSLPDGISRGDVIAPPNTSGRYAYPWDPEQGAFGRPSQVRASIVQLFFVTNWLHDWYYGSGFTEVAGNAQLDNFGRGGFDGDPLLAEAQDTRGVERNNANMSTPGDGLSPRMQMFVFDGVITPIGTTSFTVTAPEAIAGDYLVQASTFGIDDPVSASGSMVLVDDGTDTATDGCEAFVNDVAGQIALVDRGTCTFVEKALNGVAAGAAAVVVMNQDPNDPDGLPSMGGSEPTIEIPVVGVSFATGQILRNALSSDEVVGEISRAGRDRGPDVDGTLDNTIVAHEWGHYIHNRLTFCATPQCGAMSEGWGDFVALHMVVRDGDDLHGAYGLASWATGDAYFGIRRVPYSVEPEFNALTFGHIADSAILPSDLHPILNFGPNSEVHNAGEIWASALFEAYIALLDSPTHSYEEARRRMSDYIVSGMILAPINPSFTEQRDGILAAAAAADESDLAILAEAFARRGFGTGAVSPPAASITFEEVEESFELGPDLAGIDARLEVVDDCDDDGNFDGGETARLIVSLVNAGPVPLGKTTVLITGPAAAISFPAGNSTELAALGPYRSGSAELLVALSDTGRIGQLDLTVVAENAASFHPSVDMTLATRTNYDDIPETTAFDDVESNIVVWDAIDLSADIGFRRTALDGDTSWHADDPGTVGEQFLVSPPLLVGVDPFVVRFDHRYSFEADTIFWDGAVIEFSTDGGNTWVDVATLVDPGYGGELTDLGGNPLALRPAFVAQSEGYPAFTRAELDFGTALTGQEVLLRFHVASDVAVGAPGWDLDDLEFEGITNTPFPSIGVDAGICE